MAATMNLTLLVVALIAAATVLPRTQAAQYVVGDTTGWNPSGGATFYTSWAAKHNFSVGDILVFNFTTGVHDLATVSQVAFNACNTNTTITRITTGPANFTLNSNVSYYFICTFPQHCSKGQKLAITVKASSGTLPPPTGVTSAPPPPPSASSASSQASTFLLILMTIALPIFYLF
ncbi:umecyanin-like [Alnus glutinosa]|uniref:umecyanin-like n=1 Tax=Alnus glutinosa TaxID=3517 RepID=UPI002D76823F|nr:umecyanin-like [Alnus glutinosa]